VAQAAGDLALEPLDLTAAAVLHRALTRRAKSAPAKLSAAPPSIRPLTG
jgi:hypothetical protein